MIGYNLSTSPSNPTKLRTYAANTITIMKIWYFLEYGSVNLEANEYISPRIVLYITANMMTDKIIAIQGWMLFANDNVGIDASLIAGYSDCNAKLISASNTMYTLSLIHI